MTAGTKTTYFSDLSTLIDGVHQLFAQWEQQNDRKAVLDPSILPSARVAVHEWIANLVQHADFQDREPMISLSVVASDGRLKCVIQDNSEGFNLDQQLERQKEKLRPFPERGMGLIWIHCLAEDLSYTHDEGVYQLQFFISANSHPHLDVVFHA